MSSRTREIKEGRQYIGVNERPIFRLNTAQWGGSPSAQSAKVYDYDNDAGTFTDVTSTVLPSGSPSVSGDYVSLPTFVPESIGKVYLVTVKFTTGGSVLEAFAWVMIER